MGCIFTKPNFSDVSKTFNKDEVKELSFSSQISISISELPYIEPIKTMEQKQIEKIQKKIEPPI